MLDDPAVAIGEIVDALGNEKNPPTLAGLKKYLTTVVFGPDTRFPNLLRSWDPWSVTTKRGIVPAVFAARLASADIMMAVEWLSERCTW